MELMRHSDYMAAAPHSAAINVTGSSKVRRMNANPETPIEGALCRCNVLRSMSSSLAGRF